MAQETRHAELTATAPPSPTAPNLDLRAETTAPPELCGFFERTSIIACSSGSTCKFNTDINAVGCCTKDVCNWGTVCCPARPNSATGAWPACDGTATDLIGYCGYSSLPSPRSNLNPLPSSPTA
jgi:hypothetical protein